MPVCSYFGVQQAQTDIKHRQEAAIAKEKRQQAQEEKEARRKERTERQVVPNLSEAQDDDKNLLDGILQTLASGDAFASKKSRRRHENHEDGDDLASTLDF